MATKLSKNTFHEGMDKDTDPIQVKPSKYTDAINLSISQDGRMGQLATFAGTDVHATPLVATALIGGTNADIFVMGTYEAIYLIDGVETPMMLAFIYNENNTLFSVYAIKEDGTRYLQYSETVSTLTADKDKFVDCVIYKEGGTGYAYFTDYTQAMKKLPLVIAVSGKGGSTPYLREEIVLLRAGFRGEINQTINIRSGNGGDLLCGTYQFALRLHHNTQNKYTKWSLLTQPAVIGMGFSTTEQSYGGVGFVSDGDIRLTIDFEEDYTSGTGSGAYTHYQLAVIENINGGDDSSLTVKILHPETIVASSTTYDYLTNKVAKELVTIDELTLDDAAILAVKTLSIKNNRLIPGNVKYHPLDFDHPSGPPAVGSGTTTLRSSLGVNRAVGYRDYDNASNKVGYFRDEVYRFGVVYEDEFGNFSQVKVLDFDVATDNKASAGTVDWRFPTRANKESALLDASGDIQAMGLDIQNLVNHPTWAKKLHIVRVPRKKKIQFQTPLVPSIIVQPARAKGNYPDTPDDGAGDELKTLNVEAANPDGTYMPKNFHHILPKNLVRFGDFYGTIETRGGVYGTYSITNPSTWYYTPVVINNAIGGTILDEYRIYYNAVEDGPYYLYDGIDPAPVLRWRKADTNDPIQWTDIVVGDAITVVVERSTSITSTSFTTLVQTISSPTYATASGTQIAAMDLSSYNYLITVSGGV